MIHIHLTEFILYVKDQTLSKTFYEQLLKQTPVLDVPGMTEFQLSETCKLGLMPNNGIAQILAENMPHPEEAFGIPRCELYFYVEDVQLASEHALQCGSRLISSARNRNWGDKVAYFSDPDGHIIAFAEKIS